MPDLVLKSTGKKVFVPDERLTSALKSGLYEALDASAPINVELRPGLAGTTTAGELRELQGSGVDVESEASFRDRERSARIDREKGGVAGTIQAGVQSGLDEVTLGGYGALGELFGGEEFTTDKLEAEEANPIASGIGTGAGIGVSFLAGGSGAAGRLARLTPLGRATAIGTNIARAPKGAGALAKAGRVLGGGAFEGGAVGFGQGVQELTDIDDPLTIERIGSTLSSRMLYGAGIGAAAGTLAKAAEVGLHRTKLALDSVAERAGARAGVADDLAGMSRQELRLAEKAELEAIEQARIPARKEAADEIAAFRKEIREQKVFIATKGSENAEIRAATNRMRKAEKTLDHFLDDPKILATRPDQVLSALRRQEAALDDVMTKHADDLRATFATDTSGTRAQKLDAIPAMLERNRALQAKIASVTGTPTNARLTQIQDAVDALQSGGKKQGMAEQLMAGAAFSGVAGAVGGTDLPGAGFLAPILGAKAAGLVGTKVFGRFAKTASEAAARTSKAVSAFLDVTKRVTPTAPVLATSVLSKVRFAPGKDEDDAPKGPARSRLAKAYKDRESEIRGQVAIDMTGTPVMRPEARRVIAEQLKPVAAIRPDIADQLETLAAKRMEFLASVLPKRPSQSGLQTGPDTWQPSDMEMRQFARYVSAVEDPGAVEERLAAGTVTPEDREVMQEVYPERYQDIQRQILEALPTLQKQLPYQKKLALSIFSGVPVDPATSPGMLKVLQAQYAKEPEGAMQPPMPQPEFGSVKAEKATPSQTRAG